ncbi:MAG TPA: AMP-binding protein, partial [Bryobacteraceae bacterium]|nr:AMP-binding protein [Bryobacteraceae bacterium]
MLQGHFCKPSPDAIALLSPGRSPLTYRQLSNQVQSLQQVLALSPGEVTALVLPAGPELIAAFLAVTATGACAPLDPSLTESECHFYMSRLGARTLLVPDDVPGAASRVAQSLGMRVLTIHAPADQPAGVFELRGPSEAASAPGRTTDAALLLFTSATTDSPKLVPLTWSNLEALTIHDSR